MADADPPPGTVARVNVNPDGGVPKHAVPAAALTAFGVEGDRQRDLALHGGPFRAVSIFSLETIEALRSEGHPIEPGSTGENLTLAGLVWDRIQPGDRLRVGDADLEITDYVAPCTNIARSFTNWRVTRISQKVHPGWSRLYAQVLREGVVRPGDPVEWRARPAEGWPDQATPAVVSEPAG